MGALAQSSAFAGFVYFKRVFGVSKVLEHGNAMGLFVIAV